MGRAGPAGTLPKTTCFPSKCGVLVVQMKNWDPFVPGPAFAWRAAVRTRSGVRLCWSCFRSVQHVLKCFELLGVIIVVRKTLETAGVRTRRSEHGCKDCAHKAGRSEPRWADHGEDALAGVRQLEVLVLEPRQPHSTCRSNAEHRAIPEYQNRSSR